MRSPTSRPSSVRLHVCWGNYEGPHHCDVPLADIIDIVFLARASAISFEAANPRHAHEWTLFERVKLPDGKVLIPGVIESKSNFIEHPGAGGAAHRPLRQPGRARERDRRQRLRLRHLGRPGRGRSRRGVGEVRRHGGRRPARLAPVLEMRARPGHWCVTPGQAQTRETPAICRAASSLCADEFLLNPDRGKSPATRLPPPPENLNRAAADSRNGNGITLRLATISMTIVP